MGITRDFYPLIVVRGPHLVGSGWMDGWMGSVVDDVIFFGLVGSGVCFFLGGDDCEVSFVLFFPPCFFLKSGVFLVLRVSFLG